MTINVAIKCPEGIVMGADSLVTISTDDGAVASIIPYYSKLFKIGDGNDPKKSYAAGAMLNGAGSIVGRTIEDILSEFAEGYQAVQPVDNYSLQQLAVDLGNSIQQLINSHTPNRNPLLEIIIGGYSRGKRANGKRYGEIYSMLWNYQPYRLRVPYDKDSEFGTHYGGQPKVLDRFQYGIDDWMITTMWERRSKVFDQVCEYVISELSKRGVKVPDDISIPVPGLAGFDIYSLLSDYEVGETPGATVRNMKEGVVGSLETMEKFFSLQAAVNYCTFLLSCAYAENAFTFVVPSVGSEMRVASITRDEGFKFRKIWEIQTPSSPFR
jgi:hypothetical protein